MGTTRAIGVGNWQLAKPAPNYPFTHEGQSHFAGLLQGSLIFYTTLEHEKIIKICSFYSLTCDDGWVSVSPPAI